MAAIIHVVPNVQIYKTYIGRMKGLMFRKNVPDKINGIVLLPCKSVHSCFMRFPIDLVFFDSTFTVIYVLPRFAPWKISAWQPGALGCLELPSGDIDARGIQVGHQVTFSAPRN